MSILPIMVLISCSVSESKSTQGSRDAPKTLTLATGFTIDDIDPIKNGDWGSEFGWSELLMRPARGKDPQPWLLKSLDSINDRTWKLTLRKGVHFQNGKKLDAEALAKVMQYQLKNKSSLKPLKRSTVKATGNLQVTLTTTKPTPNMPSLLADEAMFAVYDQDAYTGAKGDPKKIIDSKLYTGPYAVRSLTRQKMVARADVDYWDGTPPLKQVRVKFIEEEDSRVLAVQKGEADLALYPPTKAANNLKDRHDSHWREGKPTGPTFQYRLNQNHAPLSRVAVRRAVINAIDYRELAQDVMDDRYKTANGMYSPQSSYSVKTQKSDLKTARHQLSRAGYFQDSKGYWAKDGKPLTLKVLTYPEQPDSKALAVAIQSQYKKFGIRLKIQQVADIEGKLDNGKAEWDLGINATGTTSVGGDPIKFLQTYLASDGAKNGSGIDDPGLDKLIEKISVTMDDHKRDQELRKVQAIVSDKGYMGFLGRRVPAVVAGPEWKHYTVPTANMWVDATTTATT